MNKSDDGGEEEEEEEEGKEGRMLCKGISETRVK